MEILIGAAVAGLLATPHCAAMCGGFASACARPRAGMWGWHAGRLTTYGVLGAVAGAFGAALPGPAWVAGALSALLLLWFALALAGLVPQPAPRLPGIGRAAALLRQPRPLARYAFGVLNGLLPCGMVYAALSIAIAAAQPLYGAAAMLLFGAATVPGLALLSVTVRRLAQRGLWHRRALAALVLALGLWSIAQRSAMSPSLPHAHSVVVPAARPQ